jgi:hypothetical protein
MERKSPSWGARGIHSELLLLGFDISEPTVSRNLAATTQARAGRKQSHWMAHFSDAKPLLCSTSSSFPTFISALCTASSLSNMDADAFCNLM